MLPISYIRADRYLPEVLCYEMCVYPAYNLPNPSHRLARTTFKAYTDLLETQVRSSLL